MNDLSSMPSLRQNEAYERAIYHFLTEHRNASEIVIDTETSLPFKAVYSGPTCAGIRRIQPAEFYFSDFLAEWGIFE